MHPRVAMHPMSVVQGRHMCPYGVREQTTHPQKSRSLEAKSRWLGSRRHVPGHTIKHSTTKLGICHMPQAACLLSHASSHMPSATCLLINTHVLLVALKPLLSEPHTDPPPGDSAPRAQCITDCVSQCIESDHGMKSEHEHEGS